MGISRPNEHPSLPSLLSSITSAIPQRQAIADAASGAGIES